MASPFEIFRRNQWLVVALFGLSIFAFILLDPLTSGGGDNGLFPIVLGVLLGGVAAWLISNTTGRAAVMWAAAGAVAGGLFVGLSGNFFGGNVAVQTTAGDLTRDDLIELDQRNRIANQFFASLKDKLQEREPDNDVLARTPPPSFNYTGAQADPFGFRQIPNILSQFDPNAPREFGLVFAYLLGQEADAAGMEISDDYINALINSHYGVSPTPAEFREIRTQMAVGETDLFDAIREELRHRRMFELLAPNPATLPTDAWELYRQLNQRASVSYVELPVEEFVAEAPEPTEAEVAQLFDEYRLQQPDQFTKRGFMRPAQLSLGYMKVDRDLVSDAVPTPTDAEVQAYYEENKAQYRNPAYDEWLSEQRRMENQSEVDSILDSGDAGPGLPAPADGPAMPAEEPQPSDSPESGEEPQPEPATESDLAAPTEEPEMTAPSEEPAPADPAEELPVPAEEPTEEPAEEPAMAEPAAGGSSEPAPAEGNGEQEGEEDGETPSEEPAPELPESEEPTSGSGEEGSGEEGAGEENEETAAAMRGFNAVGFASLPIEPQDEENGEQPPADGDNEETASEELEEEADEPTSEEAPAEPAMTEEPQSEDPPAEEPATEDATIEEPPAEEPAMTEEGNAEEGDGNDAPAPAADAEAEGSDAPPAPTREKPEEFLPLDAERTEAIRSRLKQAAVSEEMTRRIEAARDAMFILGDEIWSEVPNPADPTTDVTEEEAEQARKEARAAIAKRMEAYAAENGVSYKRLPFLDLLTLTGGDYAVGTAEAPQIEPGAQPQLAIAPLLGNFQTPLFNDVRIGETPDGSALYAIWKADQRLPAEQELSDEGVREAVVAAFKQQKAIEAAAARADELAAQASAEDKTLEQVAEGQTITGTEGGTALTVRETGPFTRLRVNRPTGIEAFLSGPSPVRNPVPTIGTASDEFFDAAFNTLSPGEAAGVPGFDPDRSFTLELKNREPSDEQLSELYESFLADAAADPRLYRQAGIDERRVALEAFITGLFEKYGVDRGAIGAMDQDG